MIVDGQVHGGVAQGIAQALYEEAIYDDDGNLPRGRWLSYLVPRAAETIDFELERVRRPSPTNPLGREGRGGDGHDRLDAGGHERRRRRALAVRRHRRRDARQARDGSGARSRKEVRSDSGRVRLRGRRVRRPRDRAPRLRQGREAPRRRPLAPPAHAAPPGAARAARRHRPRLRPLLRAGGRRRDRHRRAHALPRPRERRAAAGRVPARRRRPGGIGDPQVRHRGTIGGSVAHCDPASDAARRSCSPSTPSSWCTGRAGSGGSGRRELRRLPPDGARPDRDADGDPRPQDGGRRLGLPEVHAAGPGLGHRRRRRGANERRRARRADEHGPDRAARWRRRGGARSGAPTRPPQPSAPPRARARPATTTQAPSTGSTSSAC